jgi:ribonuclease R
LIKVKLLDYMSRRIGEELQIIITGVAEYGFFGQATDMPIEGLVHVSTLTDDYYYYEKSTHSLIGRRTQKRYRLGDRVNVTVVRVDQQRRQLDFRVEAKKGSEEIGSEKRKWVGKKRRHSR